MPAWCRQVVTDDLNDSEISDCLRLRDRPEDSDGQSENSLEPAPITRLLVGRTGQCAIVSHTINGQCEALYCAGDG